MYIFIQWIVLITYSFILWHFYEYDIHFYEYEIYLYGYEIHFYVYINFL